MRIMRVASNCKTEVQRTLIFVVQTLKGFYVLLDSGDCFHIYSVCRLTVMGLYMQNIVNLLNCRASLAHRVEKARERERA